jgi:hypothetical protein
VKPVPGWVAPTFGALATLTVPWTVYLAITLPKHIETRHYRAAWVGFDLGLVLLLLISALLAWRGHRQVGMTSTATATVLVIDAWFDVVTSAPGDLARSIAAALFVELPLAGLCLWLALHLDQLIARRLRQLDRRARRAAAATPGRRWGAWTARLGARVGETGAVVEKVGADVADQGVRVAEEGTRIAETGARED